MEDALAVIEKIRQAHDAISGSLRLAGGSLSDEEAITSLRSARSEWIPGRNEIVAEKQKRLEQTLSLLDEGLRNHFDFEESELPSLVGDVLMRGLSHEHDQVVKALGEARSAAADTRLDGLDREQLMSREQHIQQVLDNLSQLIAHHAAKEEALLSLLEQGLQQG